MYSTIRSWTVAMLFNPTHLPDFSPESNKTYNALTTNYKSIINHLKPLISMYITQC